MRWLIWMLGLGALATGLTLVADLNPGYVLIALPGQRIELSLNFAIVLIVFGFVAGYLLLRLLVTAVALPSRVARFRATRRRDAAYHTMIEALREFFPDVMHAPKKQRCVQSNWADPETSAAWWRRRQRMDCARRNGATVIWRKCWLIQPSRMS
jgi:hypothetical protein